MDKLLGRLKVKYASGLNNKILITDDKTGLAFERINFKRDASSRPQIDMRKSQLLLARLV